MLSLLTLVGCEAENKPIAPPKREKKFTTLVTDITFKPEWDMVSSCDIMCEFINENGGREKVPYDRPKVFIDTVMINEQTEFPIILKFCLDASPKENLKGTSNIKYSYGMTVSSQCNDLSTIDSDYLEGAFSEIQVEPEEMVRVLSQNLPVTITATIAKDGTIKIK